MTVEWGVEMAVRALPLIFALTLAACQGRSEYNMTASEATDVANGHLGEVLPQVSLNMLNSETEDLNGKWRVSYRPPEGSTGVPLVIEVNKQSGDATIVSMEQ